jgi:hypothetical protein
VLLGMVASTTGAPLVDLGPGPSGAVKPPLAFTIVNRLSMARLYRRGGRLTAQNGGFWPGQSQSPSGKRAGLPA